VTGRRPGRRVPPAAPPVRPRAVPRPGRGRDPDRAGRAGRRAAVERRGGGGV